MLELRACRDYHRELVPRSCDAGLYLDEKACASKRRNARTRLNEACPAFQRYAGSGLN